MSRDVSEAAVFEAKELFLRCMQLESDQERDAILASCESDVAARVRDLIASMDRGALIDRVFDVEGGAEVALTADGQSSREDPTEFELREAVAESPGDRIDNYKLLEVIGEGGMGTVYMAQQLKPVKRKVAIKIVKPGMDSRHVVARFEAERQALALMDHPNIARIFDGGTTSVGRPYFVMELVKGIPLTDFCERRQLSLRDRLQLFVDVCHGVQHAHQRGIIHRDLKPSNVLVTLHDDKPVVKIIDFGIAKAMNQELTDKTMFTQFAAMVGTPLYMSPEQAELSNLDVDTRSDVYSLGVMLYELLTGTTPFDRATLNRKGIDEVRRMIRETEPPRPSQRLSTVKASDGETLRTDRLREIKRTKSQLSGELDWIAMKALEKDRTRRYQAASAFGEDLQRYLDGEAVHACPPSSLYQMRKFASKHRYGFVTASILAIVILIGTAAASYQALRANAAEEVALGNLGAALGAIERLMHHVGNPDLAEIPQTKMIREEMLRDTLQFYEQLQERSGFASSEVRYQAAMARKELGELLLDSSEWSNATEVLREVCDDLECLVDTHPRNVEYRTGYARCLNRLAYSQMWGRGYHVKRADLLRRKSVGLYLQEQEHYALLAKQYPANAEEYVHAIEVSQVDQAEAYIVLRELERAFEILDPIWNKLDQEKPKLGTERFELLVFSQVKLAKSIHVKDYEKSKRLCVEALLKLDALLSTDLTREARRSLSQHLRDPIIIFRKHGDWELAMPFLERAIGQSLVLSESYPGVEEYYNHLSFACEMAVMNSDLRLREAVSKNDRELIDDAVEYRESLIERMASDYHVHKFPAGVMAKEENAVERLTLAMEEYPDSLAYQFYRAEVYRKFGHYELAIKDYEEVCQRLDGHPIAPFFRPIEPYHGLGLIHASRGDFDKAFDCFPAQISIDSAFPGSGVFQQNSLWEHAKLSLRLGEYESCITDLKELGIAEDARFFLEPGEVASCENEFFVSRYLSWLEEGIDYLPENVDWVGHYTLIQSLRGKRSLAVERLKGTKISGERYWAMYKTALINCSLGNREKYEEVCGELLLQSNATRSVGYLKFATWASCLGRLPSTYHERMIEVAERLRDNQGPQTITHRGILGAAMYRTGEYQQAWAELQAALAMPNDAVGSDAYLHYFLAMTAWHLSNEAESKKHFELANDIGDEDIRRNPQWTRHMTLQLLRKEAEILLSSG